MKIFRASVGPGTAVAVAIEVATLVLFWSQRAKFTTSSTEGLYILVIYAAFPLLTVVSALVRKPHWPLRLLSVKAVMVFWTTLPDPAMLPVRWLIHGALIAQACTILPVRWKVLVSAALVVELILVQHFFSGMTAAPPDAGITIAVVLCILIPGYLLHLLQMTISRLEVAIDRNDKLHASVMQLTNANTEFLEQANIAGEESAILERHRITRDLHDVVGQTLTNIIMMTNASLHHKAYEPEETVKLLKWIRKQAQTGLDETRSVLYELRTLKPLSFRGLRALKNLVETFGRLSRIKTKVEWGNLPWTFHPDQERAVYYLVQGSLSNAFRHGTATQVDLYFQVYRKVLHITIQDNGKGGPDESPGLGQRGMVERLAKWGGTVVFRSESYGYAVNVSLPFEEEDSEVNQNTDSR